MPAAGGGGARRHVIASGLHKRRAKWPAGTYIQIATGTYNQQAAGTYQQQKCAART
jgi:hypothetical protein